MEAQTSRISKPAVAESTPAVREDGFVCVKEGANHGFPEIQGIFTFVHVDSFPSVKQTGIISHRTEEFI
jgi:hypothetical protein